MAKPKGSPKTGGRTAGTPNKSTVEKELELQAMRELVKARLCAMADRQMDHAEGVSYLVLRQKDGSYTRATDVKQVDAALAAGAESFRLFTQAPNTQAFSALLDRTYGRPPESLEVSTPEDRAFEIVIRKPWAKAEKA